MVKSYKTLHILGEDKIFSTKSTLVADGETIHVAVKTSFGRGTKTGENIFWL